MIKMADFNKEYNVIKEEADLSIQRIMDSGWYILGKEVKSFEEEFSKYIGTKYAVGVNSGTDALLLSLKALNIKNGIQTQIHYPVPVHKQKTFIDLGIKVSLPVTEKLCKEILSLPIYPWIIDDEISRIVRVIKNAIG